MSSLKFWLNNLKVKRQKKEVKKREEHFSKERTYTHHICQFKKCKKKLGIINRYKCPYCSREFCDKHRLPENHNCKNPKLPYDMKKGFGTKEYTIK